MSNYTPVRLGLALSQCNSSSLLFNLLSWSRVLPQNAVYTHHHHLTCGVSSILHSVNLILFTLLLVHLILPISSPHQSPPSLSPSITPPAFHSRLKNSSVSQILSSVVFLFLLDCLHGSWTCTELSGHWRFFVLVSCARSSWSHSAF